MECRIAVIERQTRKKARCYVKGGEYWAAFVGKVALGLLGRGHSKRHDREEQAQMYTNDSD
jgi:hypothetical protein